MDKRIIYIVVLSIFVALISTPTGCSPWNDSTQEMDVSLEKFTIGIVTKSMNSEYTYSMKSGLEAAARDYEVDILLIHPDNETEIDVQNIMINSMVNSNIDALIVSPCDSSYIEYVELAKEKNIPVFAMDTELYAEDVPYIGADNFKIGEMAASYMIEQLGNEGEIAVLAGTLSAAPHLQRVEGFRTYLDQHSDIVVVYDEEAFCDFRHAVTKTEEILQLFPEIDGIFAANATMALGVVDRLEFSESPINLSIIGVDTQSDTIRKVMDGEITAMISQNGFDIGYQAMETVFNFLNGDSILEKTIVDSQIITKDNADEFLEVIK